MRSLACIFLAFIVRAVYDLSMDSTLLRHSLTGPSRDRRAFTDALAADASIGSLVAVSNPDARTMTISSVHRDALYRAICLLDRFPTLRISDRQEARTMTVHTVSRPYVMTFLATGGSYPVTSDEAQNAIDNYPVIAATRDRVILQGHNTPDPKQRVVIQPATRGGGPAFEIGRQS